MSATDTTKRYPIHERFYTWQGEGCHLGRAAFFIRTFGCPVHCPWCDSAGTWHPDHVPEKIEKHSVEALVEEATLHQPEFVVITGGEPTIYNLEPLTQALHQAKLPVHLETSGGFPIRGNFDWITLSPKRWKLPLTENVERANELKLIVENEASIEYWENTLATDKLEQTVWLHPEWTQHNNPAVLNLISKTVKAKRAPYRAGYQIHKLFNVDSLDQRSLPVVEPKTV